MDTTLPSKVLRKDPWASHKHRSRRYWITYSLKVCEKSGTFKHRSGILTREQSQKERVN